MTSPQVFGKLFVRGCAAVALLALVFVAAASPSTGRQQARRRPHEEPARAATRRDNSNNLATADTTIAIADLELTKTTDFDIYKPSSTVVYKLTVTNHGPASAQNVVVTDNLPDVKQAIYLLDTGGCSKAGLVLTCNPGHDRARGGQDVQRARQDQGLEGKRREHGFGR
jgi:uncharacterized repeat protein (TIGR01451 family)